jgi:hypothetical protein
VIDRHRGAIDVSVPDLIEQKQQEAVNLCDAFDFTK